LRVSVIIPTYERAEATTVALRSVLAQRTAPAEVIVVDDGSSDPYVLPADLEGAALVRVLRLEANMGAAAARNAGVAAAAGEWLAFLDSDDRWMPDKLARQAAFAEAGQSDPLTAYATGFARIDLQRGGRREELVPLPASGVDMFAAGCWFAPGSTALLHRDAFDIVGGFDASLGRLEDFDWFLRFAAAGGRLRVAPFIGSLLYVEDRPGRAKVEEASAAILSKWSGNDGDLLGSRALRRLEAYLDLECGSANFYSGNPVRAGFFLARSLVAAPRLRIPVEKWWRAADS
jgi:glycosyltransferase involved in cell wall biosynthesis